MNKDNIWVFGGTGFIGSHLVDSLKQNNQFRIILFVHKTLPGPKFENVITIQKELSDINETDFKSWPPQQIFHLARFGASKSILRKLSANKGKIVNSKLIESLRSLENPPAVHYVSGSLMYGHQQNSVNEDAPLNPVGFAKPYINGERPFLNAKHKNLNIHFYRPGWILGPSSWFKAFFWNHYIKYNKVPYYGSGSQLMSIISVEDCAGLIAFSSQKLDQNHDQNILLYPAISQKEFASHIAKKLSVAIENIPFKQIEKNYDLETAEALTSSIPLTSKNIENISSYTPMFKSLNELLNQVIKKLS
ncbi:MAG: NAD-dependent epimerase/dehydratase family protein [Bacteroidia bacterium]